MPHVDEFFAPATLAAAGLAVAIAFHPAARHAANDPSLATTPVPAAPPAFAVAEPGARVVRLPTIEVVARRGDGLEVASRDRHARPAIKPAA